MFANFIKKLFWLLAHFFPFSSMSQRSGEGGSLFSKQVRGRTLCLLIEYDKFRYRNTKTLKILGRSRKVEYECGAHSLDYVENECKQRDIDFVRVVTSDVDFVNQLSSLKETKSGDVVRIRNRGTDIAALEDLVGLIDCYEYLLCCNSSAPLKHIEQYIGEMLNLCNSWSGGSLVVGLNCNSRPSPALPFFYRSSPHIITNIFYAKSADVINVIKLAQNSLLYRLFGGFSDKYFAIYFFELGLSKYVLKNSGDLIQVSEDTVNYLSDQQSWSKCDSRYSL